MTHLTDKEIAERFLAGESIWNIAYVGAGRTEVEAALRRVMRGLAYGSEVRRVMLKQEKKKK